METERKTNQGRKMADVIEIIVGTKIAGTSHDVFAREGFAEKMGVEAIDVEGDSRVWFMVDEVDFFRGAEKIIELSRILVESLPSGFFLVF